MAVNSASTLVATVSINYEDFTEGFLTCGTCLYAYDQAEHTPKLLSCSHTICQSCLELIASSQTLNSNTEAGFIKCPICRQNIAIPNGGIGALPPSFIVNQLFDLVNKKPREFIPKCSVHVERELLFCETCDCVFCDKCNEDNNESDDSLTTISLSTITTSPSIYTNPNSRQPISLQQQQLINNKQHINEECTVIPFSTAIKRMSEILNYRSQQCSGRLDEAKDHVQREIEKLDSNCSDATRDIGLAFEKIRSIIDQREQQLLDEAKRLNEFKKNVLLEQLKSIEDEKSSLNINSSVTTINSETDVKNLSKKITDLTKRNETALALFTPRENCFICYEENEDDNIPNKIEATINAYGKIRTSKTYPPYCTSELIHYSTHLRSKALVQSIDYNGDQQKFGGDPIQAELRLAGSGDDIDGDISITDNHDGTYEVSFIPPVPGKYQLFIYIFNRPIKNCPLLFETNSHHNPVAMFGQSTKKGLPDQFDYFSQPTGLTINKHNGRIYILDSFNNRIKVLAQIDSKGCPFSFMHNIQTEFLCRSCTGIALLYLEDDEFGEKHDPEHGIQNLSLSPTKPLNPNILVTDWRNRTIYELNNDGKLLRQYNHDDLQEPTNIVVDSKGRIYVVDRDNIFVFNSTGKLLHKLRGYRYANGNVEQENNASRKNNWQSNEFLGLDCRGSLKKSIDVQKCHTLQANNAVNLFSANQQTFNISTVNKDNQTKTHNPATATLDSYYITANNNDKRPQSKTNTLSNLIMIKRKPKLNPSSSIQRGSKVVMSAASRIRSTFTLSHSTSLVSLQSMFNTNKQSVMQQGNNHQLDGQSINLTASDYSTMQSKPPTISELHEDHLSSSTDIGNVTGVHVIDNNNSSAPYNEQQQQQQQQNTIEPFGTIRGIAIGPNDELIVADDDSRVRVLDSNDNYVLRRELLESSTAAVARQTSASGRLCGMTYDAPSRQLLILRSCDISPKIQVVDYVTGKCKFIIDSHSSKLVRPSCLATSGEHVIVTDLGSDCIKKYRFN